MNDVDRLSQNILVDFFLTNSRLFEGRIFIFGVFMLMLKYLQKYEIAKLIC